MKTEERWLLPFFLWSVWVVLASLVYILLGINRWSSIVLALAVFVLGWQLLNWSEAGWWKKMLAWLSSCCGRALPLNWFRVFLFSYVLVSDLFLIIFLYSLRSDFAQQTPWLGASRWLFFIFGLATSVILYLALTGQGRRARLSLLVSVLHFFIFYGTNFLVFRFGFGYDPVIHQTAEEYIIGHGQIHPLQPFYLGQYALIPALHYLTFLPIRFLDRLLLPLLTAISLPSLIYFSLKRQGREAWFSILGVILFLSLPLAEFTFTVPHNLAVLYLVWWLWLLPYFGSGFSKLTLYSVALAATVTHPLVGVPLVLASVGCHVKVLLGDRKILSRLSTVFFVLSTSVSLPLMFGFYRYLGGAKFFEAWQFWANIDNFLNLWRWPYSFANILWSYRLVYLFEQFWPYLIILVGLLILLFKRNLVAEVRVGIGVLWFGLLGAIFWLSTLITVPGVVDYEQNEFVLRLKALLPLILLPLVIICFLERLFVLVKKNNFIWVKFLLIIPLSLVITLSYFLSYPQSNAVSEFSGWNVSRWDMVAVSEISRDAGSEPYLVLADQIFSASALRELGFEKTWPIASGEKIYPYPISPNEYLFPFTDEILYNQLSTELINQIKSQTGINRVYVAIHDYWYRLPDIEAEAKDLHGRAVNQQPYILIWSF